MFAEAKISFFVLRGSFSKTYLPAFDPLPSFVSALVQRPIMGNR